MYRIVICEDEAVMAAHIQELVAGILGERRIAHSIQVAGSGAALVELLEAPGSECHLILLDILMEGMDGMAAAKHLRRQGHGATIVFITVTGSYAIEGYDVRAQGYLLKPVDREKLKRVLLHDYQVNFLHRYLVLPQRSQTLRLAVADITYLEIARRGVAIHLVDGVVYHPAKLDDLERRLPGPLFVRCHKSYLCNLANVRGVRRYRLTAVTGEEVPVSKAYYDEVKRRFVAHLEG